MPAGAQRAGSSNSMQVRFQSSRPTQSLTNAASSHIFCIECAERLVIASQETGRCTTCPACQSQFNSPDYAVITSFNPSDDYKATVLSGLSPNIIIDCASRALRFWTYQTAQHMCYQEQLYKTLSDKFSALDIQLEKTVSDANSEIDGLQQKLTGWSLC